MAVIEGRISRFNKMVSNFFDSHLRIVLYGVGFITALLLITLSFCQEKSWTSISSGVGTGILTSLIVSITMNYENNRRLERKLFADKKLILSDIVAGSIDAYIDIVYRINEYAMFSDIPRKSFYHFHKDRSIYNEFESYLKKLDIDSMNANDKVHLERLLNIRAYQIDNLISELKRLPKHEYYFQGLLSEDEWKELFSNREIDIYLGESEYIKEFWDGGIVNYDRCIKFLRMTLYICSKIISSIQYCQPDVEKKEDWIKDNLEDRYYYEIYSHSDEVIEKELEEMRDREENYVENSEQLEALMQQYEEWENETEEDRTLKDLYCSICGFSAYTVDDILEKLDPRSENALLFLIQDNVQKSLRKSIKKQILIKKKFGNDYVQKAKKIKKNKTERNQGEED